MPILSKGFLMDDETFIEVEVHLQNLLNQMDLPTQRINNKDWRWFSRNMHIKNADHSLFDEAAKILRKVLRSNRAEFLEVMLNPNQKIIPKLVFGNPIEDLFPLLPRNEFNNNMLVPLADRSKKIFEAN